MSIRALIVDDESLARTRVRRLLESRDDVVVAGEARSGTQAIDLIRKKRPDLVFLDIQMPGLDGFDVLEALGPKRIPSVIFVTAYDDYALRAFEIHALDYLLKPFDVERFHASVDRAVRQIRLVESGPGRLGIQELIEDLRPGIKRPDRILVRSKGRILFLKSDEIEWVEAAANYCLLHVGSQGHCLRQTMIELERMLDPARFVRTHRSSMVNLDFIKEIQPLFRGDSIIILKGGARVPLSRSYRGRFKRLFAGTL